MMGAFMLFERTLLMVVLTERRKKLIPLPR